MGLLLSLRRLLPRDLQQVLSGRCAGCSLELRGEAAVYETARLRWFACARCGALVGFASAAPRGWPSDSRRRVLGREPEVCPRGDGPLVPFRLEVIDPEVGVEWVTTRIDECCPRCQAPMTLQSHIARDPGIPLGSPAGLAFSLLVIPVLALSAPFRLARMRREARTRGECPRCSVGTGVEVLGYPQLAIDAGGSLHRCPECRGLWEVDATGPRFRRVEPSAAAGRWGASGIA